MAAAKSKKRRWEDDVSEAVYPNAPPKKTLRGALVCNKCKQVGHVAKKCTAVCDICGEWYHVAANCPTKATCAHCGRYGHTSALCTFGAKCEERFIMCPNESCFQRHFLVPLQRAPADFNVDQLRIGRVDVGMRCATAALFRSQSLRTNTQISLCFGAESCRRIVQINGALVRDLRPDERSMAERVRAVSSSDGFAPDVEITSDLKTWSKSLTRGFYSFPGTLLGRARQLLELPPPKPVFVMLTADGKPIEKVIERLVATEGKLRGGLVILIGDDRGLMEDDEVALQGLLTEFGAGKLRRASLGGDVLFASHSIVLVNHYLDKLAHSCELREARKYG